MSFWFVCVMPYLKSVSFASSLTHSFLLPNPSTTLPPSCTLLSPPLLLHFSTRSPPPRYARSFVIKGWKKKDIVFEF
ncbi:hypothetical protein P8452_37359 [Trifolium repens]|nr:hypothetical protein P8452_37359 [Trifolium repens]